jgi:hypothetical protein
MKQIQITFTNPKNPDDICIINASKMSKIDLDGEAALQAKQGRTEVKIKTGFPAYCPECGIVSELLPFEHSHRYCQVCGPELVRSASLL